LDFFFFFFGVDSEPTFGFAHFAVSVQSLGIGVSFEQLLSIH